MTTVAKYKCDYCNSAFKLQYYYERHTVFCKWNKTAKEREHSIEAFDRRLTDMERDKLLRTLLYKFQKQDKEIDKLKQEISTLKKRQKTSIVKWLNSESGPVPRLVLKEWIMVIPLTEDHLFKVFEHNLTQGIIACLKDAIESSASTIIPICSFSQKIKTVYAYKPPKPTMNSTNTTTTTDEKKWEVLEVNELIKMIEDYFAFKIPFWKIYLEMIDKNEFMGSGTSEY